MDKTNKYDLTEIDSKNSHKEKTAEKNIDFLKQQNLENRKKSLELIKKNYEKINLNNKESYDRIRIPRHESNSNAYDFISPTILNNRNEKGINFEDKEKVDSNWLRNRINWSSKKPINSSDYYSHQDKSRNTSGNNKLNEHDNESCNLVDSCRSILKNEEHLESNNSTFTANAKNEFLFKNRNSFLHILKTIVKI